eukprot:TRINITY_DN121_c0_g2_i3.p1 TRINITY_DN121_c0_g2~~TRINITY_DN121_c0_g2_i3.p1  ORF type:complete len:487 (-),score=179.29 TRINITY_DN121_c0_g2_i3:185-1645(-)
MSKVLFIALLCLSAGAFVRGADVKEEDDVLVLTEANFDQVIAENEFILVEFYAPWCGHCKQLAPEYAKAAKTLKNTSPAVPLAKVDATVEKKLGERFEIRGYPTIKFFVNKVPSEFNGGRSESEIVDWIKKKVLPPSSQLQTADAAEKFVADHEVAVIYFGEEGTADYNNYVSTARGFDDLFFAHTSSAEIAANYGINDLSNPRVVLFKKFDEGRNDFDGRFDGDELKNFLNKNQFPTIQPFTQKAAQRIFGEGIPALFLFQESDEAGNQALEQLKEAANELKGKIVISTSGVREGLPKRLADYVGVAEKDIPTVRIVDPSGSDMRKFTLEGAITAQSIVQFFEDWSNGRLKPVYKSEDIPESNDEPVKVIVGKNFNDIVLDNDRDVLIEFYAPWCGHCKQLVPIYDALAKKVAHIPTLVIAKMDATANEVEGVSVSGFPTIKFYPARKKSSPVDFNGERTEDGFIKFIKEHATNPWVEATEREEL